jgi:transketolase
MSKTATRDGYGKALLELAQADRNVVALEADLGRSTRSFRITEADPARFFEMGIAEQDMVSTAAGMASLGKVPFVNSFAVFVTGRGFDQIRQQVALPNANVKIGGSSAGITQGPDGATQQSIVDAGLMRSLPNMTVIVPADSRQAEAATLAAGQYRGPVYLRLSRYETGDFLPENLAFEVGKLQVLREGEGILLASCGPVLRNVLAAADKVAAHGIKPGIVNIHTLKPFDRDTFLALARRYRIVLTIEEHSIIGGLGTAVAEVLAELEKPGPRLVRLGLPDVFGESGTADELLAKHGLDPDGISRKIMEIHGRL